MGNVKEFLNIDGYNVQTAYDDIHKLLIQAKISHYLTKSFAAHEAFGKIYDGIVDLSDDITEKLIGYSDIDPKALSIGIVTAMMPREFGIAIISMAQKLEMFAESKEYCDIENLAQELSGLGAKLKYLSRFP